MRRRCNFIGFSTICTTVSLFWIATFSGCLHSPPPLSSQKKKSEEGNENRRKLGERTNLAFTDDKCEVNMICKIAPTDVSKRKMHTRERERRDLKRESRNESIRLLLTMYDWLLLLAIFFFLFESSNYVRKRKKRERESTKEKTKEKTTFSFFLFRMIVTVGTCYT